MERQLFPFVTQESLDWPIYRTHWNGFEIDADLTNGMEFQKFQSELNSSPNKKFDIIRCHVPGREHTNYTMDQWKHLTLPRYFTTSTWLFHCIYKLFQCIAWYGSEKLQINNWCVDLNNAWKTCELNKPRFVRIEMFMIEKRQCTLNNPSACGFFVKAYYFIDFYGIQSQCVAHRLAAEKDILYVARDNINIIVCCICVIAILEAQYSKPQNPHTHTQWFWIWWRRWQRWLYLSGDGISVAVGLHGFSLFKGDENGTVVFDFTCTYIWLHDAIYIVMWLFAIGLGNGVRFGAVCYCMQNVESLDFITYLDAFAYFIAILAYNHPAQAHTCRMQY